jgi:hypothetical protein
LSSLEPRQRTFSTLGSGARVRCISRFITSWSRPSRYQHIEMAVAAIAAD